MDLTKDEKANLDLSKDERGKFHLSKETKKIANSIQSFQQVWARPAIDCKYHWLLN